MSVTGPGMQNVLQQLQATASQAAQPKPAGNDETNGANFADALVASLNKIDGMKDAANAQFKAFELGEPGIGINDVMVDMQKASIAFEMGVQVRNRMVSAYKDIMNMQV